VKAKYLTKNSEGAENTLGELKKLRLSNYYAYDFYNTQRTPNVSEQ